VEFLRSDRDGAYVRLNTSSVQIYAAAQGCPTAYRVKEREGIQNQEVQKLIRTSAGTARLGAGRFLEL
jgi:hypothetical protein